MYELVVKRRFSAAHQLRGYRGECENLHGHTYGVEVFLRSAELNEAGLAMDFKNIKKSVDGLLESYDHALLNDVAPFDEINPSAENLARVLYHRIKAELPEGVSLSRVLIWESEDAGASYFED